MFLGIPRAPISFNISTQFSSLSVSPPQPSQEGDIDTTIATRTWIDNIEYSLQVPSIFPDQIFKPQFDAYLKHSPGINVQLTVLGGPRYVVCPSFTPLENLAPLFSAARWPAGWPLFKAQTVKAMFALTQSPGGAPSNLGPYNVTLTLNGWQFLDVSLDEISPQFAASQLRKAGFCLPRVHCYVPPDGNGNGGSDSGSSNPGASPPVSSLGSGGR